jgi:DNA modification methylase
VEKGNLSIVINPTQKIAKIPKLCYTLAMPHPQQIHTKKTLVALEKLASNRVDLIYLAPAQCTELPTVRSELLESLSPAVVSFIDTTQQMHGQERANSLTFMALYLAQLHRVLKETGSLYLHCNPEISHYLKLLLDAIFGNQHYRNEIIWQHRKQQAGQDCFAHQHEVLFLYSKSDVYTFNYQAVQVLRSEKSLKRSQNVKGSRSSLHHKMAMDVWSEISDVEQLLHRMLLASSSEGDTVLAPFASDAGCEVAKQLGRIWLGVDRSNPC